MWLTQADHIKKNPRSQETVKKKSLLTILVSEYMLYPDGEEEPLLAPPTGGPGIPGMLGTEFTGLACYTLP